MPGKGATTVVTIRVPRELDRRLTAEARRRRRTRSEAAREILEAALVAAGPDPAREARRQSRLASRQDADRETLQFIASVGDDRGWR
jgi:predicted transcriptional regulator